MNLLKPSKKGASWLHWRFTSRLFDARVVALGYGFINLFLAALPIDLTHLEWWRQVAWRGGFGFVGISFLFAFYFLHRRSPYGSIIGRFSCYAWAVAWILAVAQDWKGVVIPIFWAWLATGSFDEVEDELEPLAEPDHRPKVIHSRKRKKSARR